MRTYSFDVNKLVRRLVPYFLLRPVQVAWIETILSPIQSLHSDFLAYRLSQLKSATITSESNRLTKGLQDYFNDNTIYIIHNTDYLDEAFVYLQNEGATPDYDYTNAEAHTPVVYDFVQAEYGVQIDFIVRIPLSMASLSNAVYAFVKKYVFTGINFKIETF